MSAAAETEASRARARDSEGAHRFAKGQLAAFVERIAGVYAEAKSNGFDKKALAAVVRMRAQDVNERKEFEAILETYLHALGML